MKDKYYRGTPLTTIAIAADSGKTGHKQNFGPNSSQFHSLLLALTCIAGLDHSIKYNYSCGAWYTSGHAFYM